jgi:hypothetical protein
MLAGKALDWAVAKCDGQPVYWHAKDEALYMGFGTGDNAYAPSTDWAQGGSIIEQNWINVSNEHDAWVAEIADDAPDGYISATGYTPLVAAMRCYVKSRLGDKVSVPDEIVSGPLMRLAVALKDCEPAGATVTKQMAGDIAVLLEQLLDYAESATLEEDEEPQFFRDAREYIAVLEKAAS